MGRRSMEDRNTRSLVKTAGGSTFIVSLPIEIIRELGWKAKQKVVVKRHGDGIMIKDWKAK